MSEFSTNGVHIEEAELGVPVVSTVMDITLPDDPEELRRVFIEMGGNPSWKRFQAGEKAAIARARKRVDEAKAANPFASASRRIGASIARISVVFVELIFTLGLPIALGLVLLAEGIAISDGVSVFAPSFSGLYSGALMIFLLVILFVYEVVHRSNAESTEELFSIRSLLGRIGYTIGLGNNWSPRHKKTPTPVRIVEIATIAVSRSIIFFGILGRLKTSLDAVAVERLTWHEGVSYILTQSNLETMLGYIGNILLAMTLLSSAHVVVYLIHRFYVLSTGGLDIASDGALGFLSVVSEEDLLQIELRQHYLDQIYLLKAQNDKQN